jgi:hypothetical protein
MRPTFGVYVALAFLGRSRQQALLRKPIYTSMWKETKANTVFDLFQIKVQIVRRYLLRFSQFAGC